MPNNKLIAKVGKCVDTSPYRPDHWHQVVVHEGRTIVDLTPKCANKENLIYIFRNKVSGKLYIGKTETKAKQRIYSYNWTFNTDRSEGKKEFPSEVRANPDNFEWAILKELKEAENLDDWETAFIVAFKSHINGYNKNSGGGGGSTIKSHGEVGEAPSTPTKSTKELLEKARIYEFHKDDEGYYNVQFTPTAKKVGSKVYGILMGKSVYVGKSDSFVKRIHTHFSKARQKLDENEKLPLYQRLSKTCKARIALFQDDTPYPEHYERKTKRLFEQEGFEILNVAPPGGGPAQSKKRRVKPPSR